MANKSAAWLALVRAGGAIFGAAVTGGFNYLSHRGELDAKMIELSVGILRSEPTPETEPLREWAIDVIDKRARFEFNTAQRAALLKKELPFKGTGIELSTDLRKQLESMEFREIQKEVLEKLLQQKN
jgi:hypothetical protein